MDIAPSCPPLASLVRQQHADMHAPQTFLWDATIDRIFDSAPAAPMVTSAPPLRQLNIAPNQRKGSRLGIEEFPSPGLRTTISWTASHPHPVARRKRLVHEVKYKKVRRASRA